MPARRNVKKSRTSKPTPILADLTPPDLDQLVGAPVVPPLPVDGPVESAVGPAPKAAAAPVSRGRSATGRGDQRAAQPRRYAFRRS